MKRVFFAALTLALCASCASSGESKSTSQTTESTTQSRVLTRSEAAVSQTIQQSEEFTSEIYAYKENNIIPAAQGVRISTINFEIGDMVKEGEVVATLDPTLYNQQMIALSNLQADYDRLVPVYEAGGISRQTLDQTKASLDVQIEMAEDMRKNIEIRSPISGVVTARNAEAGDLFTSQAILHIAQIDKLKVLVQISEQYYPNVKMGMAVDMTVDIYPDKSFKGEVSLIYPTLDASTRTFTVEVTVPNASKVLRPGMYGRTRFNMGSKSAILVRDVAVQKQFGSAENYVFVDNNGVAERRRVTKGRQVGDQIDILSGLKPGEKVLVTGFSRISDGTPIEVK
ncbi:MAG: efflux RND transporter periplasmic adaptor subunit [Rikenellaceae bacterium]